MDYQQRLFVVLSCFICGAVLAGYLFISRSVPPLASNLLLLGGLISVAWAGRVSGTLTVSCSALFGRSMFIAPVRWLVGFVSGRDIKPPEMKKTRGGEREVPYEEYGYDNVLVDLQASGVTVDTVHIDRSRWENYVKSAQYQLYHPDYYEGAPKYLIHKQVQHYLSTVLEPIREQEVWMDVASSTSPFPEIVSRLHGLRVYRQDLSYRQGVHGLRVGSDASSIPLPSESIDRISVHCAFEHFEGSSDTGFINELARILKPGGTVCIIPLYVCNTYHVLTNPRYWLVRGIPKEVGSELRISRSYWESFGRFYDAAALKRRILEPLRIAKLKYRLILVQVPEEIEYPSFLALEIRKPFSKSGSKFRSPEVN